MNEQTFKSETINELSTALSKAQAMIGKAEKEGYNPHFKSRYADLGNVLDAIKPALTQNGLSFVQVCEDRPDHAAISTIVLHSSGQWLNCGTVAVPVDKKNAQGYGSALTYARRYSLSAAFGVTADDDDGNAASDKNKKPVQLKDYAQPEKQIINQKLASDDQIIHLKYLKDLCKEMSISEEAIKRRCADIKVSRLEDVPSDIMARWINQLESKRK